MARLARGSPVVYRGRRRCVHQVRSHDPAASAPRGNRKQIDIEEAYHVCRGCDATFHRGWTLHSAGPNPTDRMRPVMTVVYFADGLRVAEPRTPGQQFDLHIWLPSLRPGDLAVTPINPLLYTEKSDPNCNLT